MTNKNNKSIKSTEVVSPATLDTAVKSMDETKVVGTRRATAAEKKLLAAKAKATIVEETDINGTIIEEQSKAEDDAQNIEDEAAANKLQVNIDLAAAVKAEEDGTNSTDEVALEIASLLNDETLDPTTKWASIVKLASSKIDETIITDLRLVSDAEIMRRLRLLWSKRVAAKKVNDLVLLATIDTDEAELQAHRTKGTSRRSGVVSADVDPTTLSQADLNKLIRNVQSKKCTAKKADNAVEVAQYQAEEDKLKLMRTDSPAAVKGPSAMSVKIAATITALEALPASDEITAQIEMLKSLA